MNVEINRDYKGGRGTAKNIVYLASYAWAKNQQKLSYRPALRIAVCEPLWLVAAPVLGKEYKVRLDI